MDGIDAFGEVLDRLESKVKEASKWRERADELDRELAATKRELEAARKEIHRMQMLANSPEPEKVSVVAAPAVSSGK